MEKFYTTKEVAKILNVSENFLAKNRNPKYNKSEILPFVNFGRSVRYAESDLLNYIKQKTNKIKS